MNYTLIYQQLIDRAVGRVKTNEQYFERHHVVPRCLDGSDHPSNLALLTPEEHFLAHKLLVKIYPNNPKLKFALQAMIMECGNPNRRLKAYGWVRRTISQNMRDNNPNKDGKARLQYIQKHGGPPIQTQYNLSEKGKMVLRENKLGSKNPNYGIKPWKTNKQTEETIGIWRRADELYLWWLEHQGSYMRMSKAFGYDRYSGFMNVITYFKNGWIPEQDNEWLEFKESE